MWCVELLVACLLGAPAPADDVDAAVRKVFEDSSIQRAWPEDAGRDSAQRRPDAERPAPEGDASEGEGDTRGRRGAGQGSRRDGAGSLPPRTRLRPGDGRGTRRARSPERDPDDSGGSAAGSAFAWVLLGGAAIVLLVWLVRSLRAPVRNATVPAGAPASPRPAAPAASPNPADALAAEGRFDEAVHLLLLAAWARLARPAHLADSLTSREAEEASALSGEGGAALRTLVGAVEASRFGRRPLGRAEWDVGRAAFAALERALGSASA
jgi:hypothetical protein